MEFPMTRIRLCKLLVCFSALLVVWGCSDPIIPEETEYMGTSEVQLTLEPDTRAFGVVQPSIQYRLSFSTSGTISELNVELGDRVKKGDILAKMEDSRFTSEIRDAEADLSLAQANLNKILAGAHPSLITQAASEVTGASAARPLSAAQATQQAAQVASAQAQLEYLLAQPLPEDKMVAQAQVEQVRVNLENARDRLEMTILYAPIDGTIMEILVRENEYSGIGQPVMVLANLEDLIVEFEMSDTQISSIQIGDQARLTFDALPNVEVFGTVTHIQPMDPEVSLGNFTIEIQLTDPPENVQSGMVAKILLD
jgi:multidrug resistance efflux pump